jgi:hypothetical protein
MKASEQTPGTPLAHYSETGENEKDRLKGKGWQLSDGKRLVPCPPHFGWA